MEYRGGEIIPTLINFSALPHFKQPTKFNKLTIHVCVRGVCQQFCRDVISKIRWINDGRTVIVPARDSWYVGTGVNQVRTDIFYWIGKQINCFGSETLVVFLFDGNFLIGSIRLETFSRRSFMRNMSMAWMCHFRKFIASCWEIRVDFMRSKWWRSISVVESTRGFLERCECSSGGNYSPYLEKQFRMLVRISRLMFRLFFALDISLKHNWVPISGIRDICAFHKCIIYHKNNVNSYSFLGRNFHGCYFIERGPSNSIDARTASKAVIALI